MAKYYQMFHRYNFQITPPLEEIEQRVMAHLSVVLATGGSIELSHFSEDGIVFNDQMKYDLHQRGEFFKPHGLWLSDESGEEGWKNWCEGEGFRTETLNVERKFKVDLENVIVLDSLEKLVSFHMLFNQALPGMEKFNSPGKYNSQINWGDVAKVCSGIVIAPYHYEARMNYMWYYGWDCASGCIWDLTKVKEI